MGLDQLHRSHALERRRILKNDLGGTPRLYSISPSSPSGLPAFASVLAVVAILYFAKEVFLPLAIAVLLTFALAPISSRLRKLGLPRILAVITTVALAFLALVLFALVVAGQVAEVAQNIPAYQNNIIGKIRALQESGTDNGLVRRLTSVVERVGSEINKVGEDQAAAGAAETSREPMLVEIFAPSRPIETLTNLIGPLLGPIASLGLIIVVVIFMLLEREELRDRFIRLAGYGDLHRTTEALQEAGSRVGVYLTHAADRELRVWHTVGACSLGGGRSQCRPLGNARYRPSVRSLYRTRCRNGPATFPGVRGRSGLELGLVGWGKPRPRSERGERDCSLFSQRRLCQPRRHTSAPFQAHTSYGSGGRGLVVRRRARPATSCTPGGRLRREYLDRGRARGALRHSTVARGKLTKDSYSCATATDEGSGRLDGT